MAESAGCTEMAVGFWSKAYELTTGQRPSSSEMVGLIPNLDAQPVTAQAASVILSSLPAHLQPGKIITMQPVDAPHDRNFYINDPAYIGMPKRDGVRTVVIVETGRVYYQSRSTKLRPSPSVEMDKALLKAADLYGDFILDGELVYHNALGGEHRTGAQAATWNMTNGYPGIQPQPKFCAFDALFVGGEDLTGLSKFGRLHRAENILSALPSDLFEAIPMFPSSDEKKLLVHTQMTEGREGEVWVRHYSPYIGGKTKGDFPSVRTKYLEELEVVIIGLTPTTAEGRPFGAIEVGERVNGGIVPIGSIGTGYTVDEMWKIRSCCEEARPGSAVIRIATQGRTESGKVWHGRYLGM